VPLARPEWAGSGEFVPADQVEEELRVAPRAARPARDGSDLPNQERPVAAEKAQPEPESAEHPDQPWGRKIFAADAEPPASGQVSEHREKSGDFALQPQVAHPRWGGAADAGLRSPVQAGK